MTRTILSYALQLSFQSVLTGANEATDVSGMGDVSLTGNAGLTGSKLGKTSFEREFYVYLN